MHDQVNRSAPAYACFVVEPPASGNDDVMPLGLCAERRSLGLHVESVMREHVSQRGVSTLDQRVGKGSWLDWESHRAAKLVECRADLLGDGQSEDGSFAFPAGGGAARGGSSGVMITLLHSPKRACPLKLRLQALHSSSNLLWRNARPDPLLR